MATPSLPLTPAPGRMNVDFEERIDFARLRAYRLDRARKALEQAGLGALLVFDNNNIRYLTASRSASGPGTSSAGTRCTPAPGS